MNLTTRIEKLERSPEYQARQDEAQRQRNQARKRELAQIMMGKLVAGGIGHDEARAYLISQRVRACDIDAPS